MRTKHWQAEQEDLRRMRQRWESVASVAVQCIKQDHITARDVLTRRVSVLCVARKFSIQKAIASHLSDSFSLTLTCDYCCFVDWPLPGSWWTGHCQVAGRLDMVRRLVNWTWPGGWWPLYEWKLLKDLSARMTRKVRQSAVFDVRCFWCAHSYIVHCMLGSSAYFWLKPLFHLQLCKSYSPKNGSRPTYCKYTNGLALYTLCSAFA
jgi:hypothetical protein